MIKKIIITILTTLFFMQTAMAEDKNNNINKKFKHFLKCINEKIDETKDYQIKKWDEGKSQITHTKSNLLKGKTKLTAFFSDFPDLDKK